MSVTEGISEQAAREFLKVEGWPIGLQESFLISCRKSPLRFFIVDDSGSMNSNDGHKLLMVGQHSRCFISSYVLLHF